MKNVFCLFFIFLFAAPVYVSAQDAQDSVICLPINISVPDNSVKKGHIKVGNNATVINCDYEAVIKMAKEKATAMGGNIVKITALIPPAFISKCYRVEADVYYCNNHNDPIFWHKEQKAQSLQETNKFVMLYIYRLKDTMMLAPSYKLHLDDSVVLCQVKSKSREAIKIYKDGQIILSGKTMHRGSLKLDTKFGSSYYIRCGITGGELNTTPEIELIEKQAGEAEYAKDGRVVKNQGDEYLNKIH